MTLFPNDLPRRNPYERAQDVAAFLSHRKQISDRITLLCRAVDACHGEVVLPSDPQHAALVQALKDLKEIWYIVKVFGDRLLEPPLQTRFNDCLKDRLQPSDAAIDTTGRDAQFELFIGALAQRAGLLPEYSESGSDWIARDATGRTAIEAKRPKSEDAVDGIVRKAVSQIGTANCRGIIFLDASHLVGAEDHVARHYLDDAQRQRYHQHFTKAFGDRFNKTIQRRVAGSSVGLVVVHTYVLVPAGQRGNEVRPWGNFSFWSEYLCRDPSSPEYASFAQVWGLLHHSLPNW